MPHTIDAFFRPRGIAVVGASRKRGTLAAEVFHNLVTFGYDGPVFPVNPSAPVVQSVCAYPRVSDIPLPVDLAVIVVPKRFVSDAVDDCLKKGVKGIVIVSAGFAETGPEGKALQDELVRRVRAGGARLIGPNCLGVLSTDDTYRINTTFAAVSPKRGSVSFSSQSGALGVAILDYAQLLGIGIRHFVSVGNKADVSGNDLLEYWEEDAGTEVILLYLESFGNPRRFMELARRISRKKPIVMVKSGRTESGARAASSHTGSLSGLDAAVDAVSAQAGVIRTNRIEGLFDVAMLLANQPIPAGRRVAILTNAGGPAIMASDACDSQGLEVPRLSRRTERALRTFLPMEASVGNPVDMIASANAEHYERATRLLLEDENVDALIVLFVPPIVVDAPGVARAIRRGAEGATKPVLTSFLGTHGVPEALSSLRQNNFPSYAFPESAARALSRVVRYGEWLRQPAGRFPTFDDLDAAAARAVLAGESGRAADRWLSDAEVRTVLAAYGISSPKTLFASSPEGASEAAASIGFPVALKLASETITHKTDVGGVLLDLDSPEEVAEGYRTIAERLGAAGFARDFRGVIVQEMLTRGVETFIGVTQDPKFGPLVAFGMGGVNIEVWGDVVFRVCPLSDVDADQMIDGIRGKKLLDGYRGGPKADRPALVDALLRVSCLMRDFPEIEELDINPLYALEPGQGVVAVDARIRAGSRASTGTTGKATP